MIRTLFDWKSLLVLVAIVIVTGTLFYSRYLSEKISENERVKVDAWVKAQQTILLTNDPHSLTLAAKISSENRETPIIETDEHDKVTGNYFNIDSNLIVADTHYLQHKVDYYKSLHPPILLVLSDTPYKANKYYYGQSRLREEVKYYPIVQLLIVALFITVLVMLIRTNNKSVQNRLWAGMAKETAHQLGTPVSSLQGWVEVLRHTYNMTEVVPELEKDVQRLQLISDRFGKIGSTPSLEQCNVIAQVKQMAGYMKKRAGANVLFEINTHGKDIIEAMISPPLFDWVIENLLKNALDSMYEKGKIIIDIVQKDKQIIIDITDTGKGIFKTEVSKVFKPGYTTKKRGWGIGLALAKRIVEQYHKGSIFVKHSEQGKGTTFRIILIFDF